jgi:hypothetical protein
MAYDGSVEAAQSGLTDDLFPGGIPGPGEDEPAATHTDPTLTFSDYDLSRLAEYSDLDYEEIRTSLGFDYDITDAIAAFASISYYEVEDNAPYIQDFTGDATLVRGGMVWKF